MRFLILLIFSFNCAFGIGQNIESPSLPSNSYAIFNPAYAAFNQNIQLTNFYGFTNYIFESQSTSTFGIKIPNSKFQVGVNHLNRNRVDWNENYFKVNTGYSFQLSKIELIPSFSINFLKYYYDLQPWTYFPPPPGGFITEGASNNFDFGLLMIYEKIHFGIATTNQLFNHLSGDESIFLNKKKVNGNFGGIILEKPKFLLESEIYFQTDGASATIFINPKVLFYDRFGFEFNYSLQDYLALGGSYKLKLGENKNHCLDIGFGSQIIIGLLATPVSNQFFTNIKYSFDKN